MARGPWPSGDLVGRIFVGGMCTVPIHPRSTVKKGADCIVTIPFGGSTTNSNGDHKTRRIVTRRNSMAPQQRGAVLLLAVVAAILFILFCFEGIPELLLWPEIPLTYGAEPGDVSRSARLLIPKEQEPEVSPFRARNAIVSNVQNDWYVHYALLLGYTIKKYNPALPSISAEMVLLIPRQHDINQANMDRLRELGWKIKFEDDLTVEGMNNLSPNWRRNLIKLRLWSWVEYRKILFLDADTMVLGDISLLLHDGFGTRLQ